MAISKTLEDCVERFGEPSLLDDSGLRLKCSFALRTDNGADRSVQTWNGDAAPSELEDFWNNYDSARLFEDVDYGQWGLELLSPEKSRSRSTQEFDSRPTEIDPRDVVIGEFLGDLDLLIYAAGEDGDRRILVSLPTDPREDWYAVGDSLESFLATYVEQLGAKHWTSR